MKKIFISRQLTEDSIFRQQLTAENFEVHGETLLSFAPVPFNTIPKTDWLFFYSQKGVQYFFEQYQKNGIPTPFPFKSAAFGPVTASVIKQYGVTPYFIGTGKAEITAKSFLECIQDKSVCFVRAKNSRRSVQKILDGKINARELIVYENEFRQDFDLPHFDILVFTSPMNAQAYFSKYKFRDGQHVVAIGATTQSALRELGVASIVSESPSEGGLVDCCLGLV